MNHRLRSLLSWRRSHQYEMTQSIQRFNERWKFNLTAQWKPCRLPSNSANCGRCVRLKLGIYWMRTLTEKNWSRCTRKSCKWFQLTTWTDHLDLSLQSSSLFIYLRNSFMASREHNVDLVGNVEWCDDESSTKFEPKIFKTHFFTFV